MSKSSSAARKTHGNLPDTRRHQGQWILADCVERTPDGGPVLKVLAIGDTEYPGLSTGNVDATAGKVLIGRMRAAVIDKQARREHARINNVNLVTAVQPVFGAHSGNVLGVLGCYQQVGTDFSAPPSVGTHEWYASPKGGLDQHISGYWSREIYINYGLPIPEGGVDVEAPWGGPQFIGTLIAEAYRAAMLKMFQVFFAETTEQLHIHYYKIIDQTTGEIRSVRLATRRDLTVKSEVVARGLSTIISPSAMAQATSSGWKVVEAALKLSRDAQCVIDTSYLSLPHANREFFALGVAVPDERELAAMFHPEDFPRLTEFLKKTEELDAKPLQTVRGVRLRLTTGEWLTVDVVTRELGDPTDHPHNILCRVSPASRLTGGRPVAPRTGET